MVENAVRLFGLNNLAIESALRSIENEFSIDLGKQHVTSAEKDDVYYPQFEARIRQEAAAMSKYYEMFYCLETTIRELIAEKLLAAQGADWWENAVPAIVRDSASKNMRREVDSGVTVRSDQPIDYTTFGELGEIIKSNWETFADTFNSQRAVEKVMSNLNLLRGPIAHCCLLAPDEITRLQLSVRDWFRLME
jgi:hypothetical protein